MTLLHRSSLVLGLVLAADGCAASPGGPIEYVVSLTAPQTQMVDLSIRVPDVTGAVLDLALPVWRPGRYVVLDPAGTVRAVRAFGPGARDLRIEKIDKATWRVTTDGATEVRL